MLFVSGAAVLALELLASRILTPYFGVSLVIWAGILSTTLVALALGYWTGGRLAAGAGGELGRLAGRFAALPSVASGALLIACLAYPDFFPRLAASHLVLGAFAGCVALLFVPLVALSAMSPLLVAIRLAQGRARGADAGAARVLVVGTSGSVAGVLLTAFGAIPYLGNFSASIAVALALGLVGNAAAAGLPEPLAGRRRLGLGAVAATLAAALLLWQADAWLGRLWPAEYGGARWRVEARFGSRFGTVKVLRSEPEPSGRFSRIYFHDGLIQNAVDSGGRSLTFYTHALEALAHAYRPGLRSALVLGLGAGIVPMRLAAEGVAVDVVEVDPASLRAATGFFGFDPGRVRVSLADARTHVRRCERPYDVVLVDLFHGDGTPEYLVTRDFFADLRRCLGQEGVAVFNTVAVVDRPTATRNLLATLHAELPYLALYRPDWPGAPNVNYFAVASTSPLPEPVAVRLGDVPAQHAATLPAMLAHPIAHAPDLFADAEVVTDARGGVYDLAQSQLGHRRALLASLPPAFLAD
jgi:spermidine synthase